MDNQADNKFTWVLKNFSSLQPGPIYSDEFFIDGCKWGILAYPKGFVVSNHCVLYLRVADDESLPPGWSIRARFSLTVVNQNPNKNFKGNEAERWFDHNTSLTCYRPFFPLSKLYAEDGGFLVNNEIKIVAEVEVLEVVAGSFDVLEESEAATRPQKKTKVDVVSRDLHNETVDVNGFQVPPSQVEFVRRIFEKHPDIALGFRSKNPHLKETYMNILLSLTAILRQLPQEISKADLANAYGLLSSLKDAGFKVDWLKKKMDEVSKKKENEKAWKSRMKEIQKEWKELNAKVLDARAPLSLDDVV